jgi:hypothetical protein
MESAGDPDDAFGSAELGHAVRQRFEGGEGDLNASLQAIRLNYGLKVFDGGAHQAASV